MTLQHDSTEQMISYGILSETIYNNVIITGIRATASFSWGGKEVFWRENYSSVGLRETVETLSICLSALLFVLLSVYLSACLSLSFSLYLYLFILLFSPNIWHILTVSL